MSLDHHDSSPLPFANLRNLRIKNSSYEEFENYGPIAHKIFLNSIEYLYTQLDSLEIKLESIKCDYEILISSLIHLLKNNVSLTSLILEDFISLYPLQSENWNLLGSLLSGLTRLTSVFLAFPPQREPLFALLLDGLRSIESLRILELGSQKSFSESTDNILSSLVEGSRLQTFTSRGWNTSRRVIDSIGRCKTLTTLNIEILAADVVTYFSLDQLPQNLTLKIYVKKDTRNVEFDFENADFSVNFEGVQYLSIMSYPKLPVCIFNSLKTSTSLREISLTVYGDPLLSFLMSDIVHAVKSLTTVSIHLDVYNESVIGILLEALESNEHVTNVVLVGSPISHSLPILENPFIQSVTFDYFRADMPLPTVISMIMENRDSAIKRVKIEEFWGKEIELLFWNVNLKRVRPILIIRKYESDISGFEIVNQIIKCWNVGENLVESIVFDDLTHIELKRLKRTLKLDERMQKISRLRMGYRDGSFCLWYEESSLF
ncbi:hypothetical protein HK098_005963 [Nowakowskiella sp. JEL0407]|nr:hypothetical protein HK098_005963 [Nowakowskiella sp. JEL0407]